MKQTAMTISMFNNNVKNMHNNDDEQRMTSLEIAQLSGKPPREIFPSGLMKTARYSSVNRNL